ncbi:MAG: hypothetical protein ACXVGH_01275 [Mycobacteriales bacterium]
MRLPRRPEVPAPVRALATGERRLAWGVAADGSPLVATPTALHAGEDRLPWAEVERVAWEPPVLTVVEAAEVEGAGRVRRWELQDDARLAETVRERVTGSIGWSDRRALHPAGHVRAVGRRVPGEDLLQWQLVFAPGTDPHDPLLRAQAQEWLEGLRRTIG